MATTKKIKTLTKKELEELTKKCQKIGQRLFKEGKLKPFKKSDAYGKKVAV